MSIPQEHTAPPAAPIVGPIVGSIGLNTVGSIAERSDADFLTLTEVAEILRVPVNTLRWWRQQGTGPRFFKIGRRLVTTVGDLQTWVDDRKRSPGAGPR